MIIEKGDCVRVDDDDLVVHWTGICTWTDGYKFEFLINGVLDTWTRSDLEVVHAQVINKNNNHRSLS